MLTSLVMFFQRLSGSKTVVKSHVLFASVIFLAVIASAQVTSVTATVPLTSSGGTTPNISAAKSGNGSRLQTSNLSSSTNNDVATLDGNGNTQDSGAQISSLKLTIDIADYISMGVANAPNVDFGAALNAAITAAGSSGMVSLTSLTKNGPVTVYAQTDPFSGLSTSQQTRFDWGNGLTVCSAKAYGPYVQPMGGLTAYM